MFRSLSRRMDATGESKLHLQASRPMAIEEIAGHRAAYRPLHQSLAGLHESGAYPLGNGQGRDLKADQPAADDSQRPGARQTIAQADEIIVCP